jgi:Protein of unknown function (DUF3039)
VLRDDLLNGWTDAAPTRARATGRPEELCPLAELPHPLITKARGMFGSDPDGDSYHQMISCAAPLGLMEVRTGQWRGAVWTDPDTGVRWLVAAGLAKGEHEDNDDFYVELASLFERGRPEELLPTAEDHRLLKIETAHAVVRAWELHLQEQIAGVLADISAGGSARISVTHPTRQILLATVDINMAVEPGDGYSVEAYVLEIDLEREFRGSNLAWTMTLRLLTCICPPEQDWDRFGDTLSAMATIGHATQQSALLFDLAGRGELCRSAPGAVSHYAHRKNLADSSIEGHAVRAMCGVFFVPFQDHDGMPVCPECRELRDLMPE